MLETDVLLRHRFVRGRSLHYRARTAIRQQVIDSGQILGGQESSWETVLTERVLDVDEDESAHILLVSVPTTEQPQGHSLGQPLTRQVMYLRLDPTGLLQDVAGPHPPAVYCFPNVPVGQGATWETTIRVPFPMLGQDIPVTTRYQLERREMALDVDCVRVSLRTDENTFDTPIPGGGDGQARVMVQTTGFLHFSPTDGMLVRLELVTHSVPRIGTVSYDTTTTFTQELVEARQRP